MSYSRKQKVGNQPILHRCSCVASQIQSTPIHCDHSGTIPRKVFSINTHSIKKVAQFILFGYGHSVVSCCADSLIHVLESKDVEFEQVWKHAGAASSLHVTRHSSQKNTCNSFEFSSVVGWPVYIQLGGQMEINFHFMFSVVVLEAVDLLFTPHF